MKNTQKGFSPLEIILIIFVVVLVGIMGYLGYKQMTKSEPIESVKSNYVKKVETEKFTEEYSGVGAGKEMSIKYPKSWKFEKAQDGTTGVEQFDRLIGPEGKAAVLLSFITTTDGANGIGGACIPEENPTISKIKYEALKDAPSYYLMTSEYSDSNYKDNVVNQEIKDVAKQGNSACDLFFAYWLIRNDNGSAKVAIESPELYQKSSNISESELHTYHGSKDFETAQEIVKTLKIED